MLGWGTRSTCRKADVLKNYAVKSVHSAYNVCAVSILAEELHMSLIHGPLLEVELESTCLSG